jgi:hypothetical protein
MTSDTCSPSEEPKLTVCAASGPPEVVSLLRRKGFVLALILGLLNFWTTRFFISSDGISYLEIARKYADGDWKGAANAYWSPLYSWILAAVRLLTGKNDRWELTSLHLVNLLAYVIALILFERLFTRLWPNASATLTNAQWKCLRFCSSCLFLWAGIHMIGMGYGSSDMIVLALNLAAALLLLKIRNSPDDHIALAQLGAVLGLSYLCKTAMLLESIVCVAIVLWIGRAKAKVATRAAALLVPLVLLCLPWVIALHAHQEAWTFGESGKLNYAWEVSGAARIPHWQGEPDDIGTPLHPTRLIWSHPNVYEFGSPLNATYPPWYDPSYWYAGVTPHFQVGRQLKVLSIDLLYAAALLCIMPGCLAAALVVIFSKRRGGFIRSCRSLWFLLVPSFTTILLYCFVYVETRYIAGPVVVIGLIVLGSALPLCTTQQQLDLARITAFCVCAYFVGIGIGPELIRHILRPNGPASTDQQTLAAAEARSLGLKRDDRIAYVGFGINAYWALLDGVKITAEVPVVYSRDGQLNSFMSGDYVYVNEFWNSSVSTRDKIFSRLKNDGVRAVVANAVPAGTNMSGWIKLNAMEPDGYHLANIYIKFL